MGQEEQTIRLHSIISRFILRVQTGKDILDLGRSIGIPNSGYIDFLVGIIYSASQSLFREESGLDVKIADNILLEFWQKEGKDIRTRLIQLIEEKE